MAGVAYATGSTAAIMSLSTPGMSGRRTAITLVLSAAGVLLLVWQIRRVGLASIAPGLARVGWGFLVIVLAQFLRFSLGAIAWMALVREPAGLGPATVACIGGDALGNLTPLSLIVSEPAKAMHLKRFVPVPTSLASLTAENFFYTVSIAIYILLGTGALLLTFPVDATLRWAGGISFAAMASLLAVAAWLAWQRPGLASALAARMPVRWLRDQVDRIREFEVQTYGSAGGHTGRLAAVIGCEAAFHALSWAESWFLLLLLTGTSLPIAALVLDSFGRVSNIVFRLTPFRLGPDQVLSEEVARAVGLLHGVGTTFSLVRTGRVLVWTAIGLAITLARAL